MSRRCGARDLCLGTAALWTKLSSIPGNITETNKLHLRHKLASKEVIGGWGQPTSDIDCQSDFGLTPWLLQDIVKLWCLHLKPSGGSLYCSMLY